MQEWFSMLSRCTLSNHFCCSLLRLLSDLASLYYSNTPEEQRILVPLPKLKGSLCSFFDLTRRGFGSTAPRLALEKAPHLRHSLRFLAPRRGGRARPEAQHAAGADRSDGDAGVGAGALADALDSCSTTRSASRTRST